MNQSLRPEEPRAIWPAVVPRPLELHRFDSTFDRRVRRHHENLRTVALRNGRRKFPDQVKAGHLRHQVVDHQNVKRLLGDETPGLARARGCHHLMPLVTQR